MADALRIDDDVMLLAAFSVLNDAVDQSLLVAVVTLRKKNVLRSVGKSAPESDVAGITAHNLDDPAALMGGRGITHLIDRLHGRVHCGVRNRWCNRYMRYPDRWFPEVLWY